MGTLEFHSYLQRDDQFIPIEEWSGPVEDLQYIEGAIEMRVDGEIFVGLEHFDLVDQLWAYFLNLIQEVADHGKAEFYFPDQPLLFQARLADCAKTVVLRIGPPVDRSVQICWNSFARGVIEGASEFIDNLERVDEQVSDMFQDEVSRIRILRHMFDMA